MKKFRGQSQAVMTSKLQTPVGTYQGEDVLEGFAADSEFLGRSNETNEHFDQSFYKLCKLDNLYIFDTKDNTQINIPPMNLFHFLSTYFRLVVLVQNRKNSGV